MGDYECKVCGTSHDADNTHEGAFVYGGYGSPKYDETRLIWLTKGLLTLNIGDHICDDCIDTLVADKHLEVFADSFEEDVGRTMSPEGYARVFILSAEQMYRICADARHEKPMPLRPVSSEDVRAITKLRACITNDPTEADQQPIIRKTHGSQAAREVGAAHVLAGLILGYFGGEMPDFSQPAWTFAAQMVEIDSELAETMAAFELTLGKF